MFNNAHMEKKQERLNRLKQGSYVEAIETLLNSIDNFFNNELKLTPQYNQTSLLFLGIHAVILTISKALFNDDKETGYKKFLETFVDSSVDDKNYSHIAHILHNWRNVLAHQWIGSLGHEIQYDYEMKEGWKKEEDVTKINPRIYCEQYLKAFAAGGKIWDYENILTTTELEAAKQRIVEKYERR